MSIPINVIFVNKGGYTQRIWGTMPHHIAQGLKYCAILTQALTRVNLLLTGMETEIDLE